MEQNKKWIICLSLSLLFTGSASALQMSELKVRSLPGEPLEAVVEIEDVPKNLTLIDIDLATEEEFSQAVIGYTEDLEDLEFEAHRERDGKVQILITTNEALEEEVTHFLLAVKITNARLLREYVIIEEDDIYITHAQPTIIQLFPIEKKEKPRPVILPQPVIAIPESAEDAEGRDDKKEVIVTEQEQYRVKAGDTLWIIAKQNVDGQNNANFYKVLAALKELNPNAFINNNINQLRTGAVLTLPTLAQIRKMDLREQTQAVQVSLNENNNPIAKSAVIENAGAQTSAAVSGNPQAEQLRILTPQTEAATQAANAEEIKQLRDELSLSNETLTEVQRNNQDLQKRIAALENQIATLKELVAAREQQSAMQKTAGANNTEATPGVPVGIESNELWQKISTGAWGIYLAMGLMGLIILVLVLRMIRRRAINKDDYAQHKSEFHNTAKEYTEIDGGMSESEDMSVKLELAQAYYDIGDTPGARILLLEILRNGSLSQRHAAEALMAKIEMESRQK